MSPWCTKIAITRSILKLQEILETIYQNFDSTGAFEEELFCSVHQQTCCSSLCPSLFYILFRFYLKTFLCLFQLSFTNNFIASQKEKHSCSMKRIKDNQYKMLFEEVGSLLFFVSFNCFVSPLRLF